MCMFNVIRLYEPPSPGERTAWKVVYIHVGYLTTLYDGQRYEYGRKYTAELSARLGRHNPDKTRILADSQQAYPLGFHCYCSREEACQQLHDYHDYAGCYNTNFAVIEVKIRNIVAEGAGVDGTQQVVAQEIEFIRPPEREERIQRMVCFSNQED